MRGTATPYRPARPRLEALRPALLVLLLAGFLILPARADDEPGAFDYYVLSLSWSPAYCASEPEARGSRQCSGERSYAFVLHGLWPQYERGWPENCDTGRRPWVPEAQITRMLDIMPARGLVIHQYRKHGTCSGLGPKDYFETARAAFEKITIPPRYRRPGKSLTVSPGEVEDAFLEANPALTPETIAVRCKDRRLTGVRICLTRALTPRPCGPNETRARLCRRETIVMPPVRGGR